MAKFGAVVVSLILFACSGLTLAEDNIEALKAENAELLSTINRISADRNHLRSRLRRAIAYSRSQQADLREQLASATSSRDHLRDRLRRAIAYSKARQAGLEDELSSATSSRDQLRSRLRRAIAYSKARQASLGDELSSATSSRDQLRSRLRRAIAYSKSRKEDLGRQLAAAVIGRDHLREKLLNTLNTSKADKARLEKELNSAVTGRDHLREKLLSTLKAPGTWADDTYARLSSTIGELQGTEISTSKDNSVNIRIGIDTGLFRTGGTLLTGTGGALLSQIAQQLLFHQDASVTVVGHTDNIPVGEGNRFENNQALSLARAVSALEFLQNEGLPVRQLSAAGYGADYPIASNDTEDGRRLNRRVEIELRARK